MAKGNEADKHDNLTQWVTFAMDGETYGIDVMQVQEVLRITDITPVPGAGEDGDGRPDLITGKRWWSHGKSEPGSDGPAAIYWLKNTKGADGIATFTPMT